MNVVKLSSWIGEHSMQCFISTAELPVACCLAVSRSHSRALLSNQALLTTI